MIRVNNISKIYNNKEDKTVALDNISIKLPSKGMIEVSAPGHVGNGVAVFTVDNACIKIEINLLDKINISVYKDDNNLNIREYKGAVLHRGLFFDVYDNKVEQIQIR